MERKILEKGDFHIIDTNGCEFGYELIQCVPHAYYLHCKGVQVVVLTSTNMERFYYFLPRNQVYSKYKSREFTYPDGTELNDIHYDEFNPTEWTSPNYVDHFKDYDLDLINYKVTDSKPLLMISNKYTFEHLRPPVNYLSLPLLDTLLSKLKMIYTVIYNRPRPLAVPQDRDQDHLPFGDWVMIKEKHPEVIDLNELDTDVDYNTRQIVLASRCSKFISVQGGTSILSSLFGGENLIYAFNGEELKYNSYSWYNKFSGTEVEHFNDWNNLYNRVIEKW